VQGFLLYTYKLLEGKMVTARERY